MGWFVAKPFFSHSALSQLNKRVAIVCDNVRGGATQSLQLDCSP